MRSPVAQWTGRHALQRFRKALMFAALKTDAELALKTLADDLDYERRRLGMRVVKLRLATQAFDYADKFGFAYDVSLRKNVNQSALIFITEKYRAMLGAVQAERDTTVPLLQSLLKCRTAKAMKKKIRTVL